MPEPRSRTSSDVPAFDTYPAPAPEEVGAPPADIQPERELPEWGDRRLNQAAERVGRAVGNTVAAAREARERIRSTKDRVVTMPSRARETAAGVAEGLRQEAAARAEEIRDAAAAKLADVRAAASEGMEELRGRAADVRERAVATGRELRARTAEAGERARRRMVRLADEEPLKVILAAGIAAFAAGVALRLWRSSHD